MADPDRIREVEANYEAADLAAIAVALGISVKEIWAKTKPEISEAIVEMEVSTGRRAEIVFATLLGVDTTMAPSSMLSRFWNWLTQPFSKINSTSRIVTIAVGLVFLLLLCFIAFRVGQIYGVSHEWDEGIEIYIMPTQPSGE